MIPEQLSLPGGDLEASGTEGGMDFAEDAQMAPGVTGMDSSIVQVAEDF